MTKAIRIDWEAIKARWGSEIAEFHLALLPKGAAQLILAIQERLKWEATYRIEGYDYSDFDELQEIVDLGLAGLTDTMRLADLITALEGIETAIDDIDPCCDSALGDELATESDIVQLEQDTTGSDIVVGEGTPPEPAQDWTEYDGLHCDAAYRFVDGLGTYFVVLSTISELTTLATAASVAYLATIMAGFAIIPAAVAGALSFGGLLAFGDALRELLGTDNPFETEREEVGTEEARDELACAIYSASNPTSARAAFVTVLNDIAPNAAPHVELLPLDWFMRRVFSLDLSAAGGYGGGCPACGPVWDIDEFCDFGSTQDGECNFTGGGALDPTAKRFRHGVGGFGNLRRNFGNYTITPGTRIIIEGRLASHAGVRNSYLSIHHGGVEVFNEATLTTAILPNYQDYVVDFIADWSSAATLEFRWYNNVSSNHTFDWLRIRIEAQP